MRENERVSMHMCMRERMNETILFAGSLPNTCNSQAWAWSWDLRVLTQCDWEL